MKKRIVWLVASCLVVLALLAAACAPAVEKEAAPAVPTEKEAAPAVKEAAPVTPAEREAAPAVKESVIATASISPAVQKLETSPTSATVKATLKKNDSTVVVKEYVKPKYGGIAKFSRTGTNIIWDEMFQTPWTNTCTLLTNEALIQGDWARGPAGTNEVDYVSSTGWVRLDYIYGMLAESWEWPDDTTAIFHIRQGVRWALDPNSPASRLVNGREFNADDVVWNIKRIYIDNPGSPMAGMAGVSRPTEVYAKDKWTVVIKSAKGQIGKTWEYVGDWSYYIPREVVEKYGDMNQWERVVGTGPFILTDYVPMSSVTYVRNPNYWMKDPLFPENQLPYLDGVKVYVIVDKSTYQAAVRTAKIDWVTAITWEDAQQLITGTPQLKYKEYPSGFTGFHWRLDKPELPFKDIRVRRALLMAINQQEIIDTYYGGHAQIVPCKVMNLDIFKDVWTPIEQLPPAPDGFDNRKLYGYYIYPDIPKEDKVRQEAANLAEARKLLADAGYPNGFKFSVNSSSTPGITVDQLLIAKGYWEKIGVELILDLKETAVQSSISLRKLHKEAITGGRWNGEPYGMFMVRAGNQWNWAMVDNPIFEEFYNQITALYFDPVARDKVTKLMDQAAISYVPYYVFPSPYYHVFWWPWVKNFDAINSLDVGGYYFQKYMWIDQELKSSLGYK